MRQPACVLGSADASAVGCIAMGREDPDGKGIFLESIGWEKNGQV